MKGSRNADGTRTEGRLIRAALLYKCILWYFRVICKGYADILYDRSFRQQLRHDCQMPIADITQPVLSR